MAKDIEAIKRAADRGFRQEARDRKARQFYGTNIAIAKGLYHGDFRELAPQIIPANSVHLIHVDPLYDAEYLWLCEAIAEEADRQLIEGGVLSCNIGQTILRDALLLMGKHIQYNHLVISRLRGGDSACTGSSERMENRVYANRCFRQGWKARDPQKFVSDVIPSPDVEKQWHPMQRPICEPLHFINNFTKRGNTVVDLCCGGGTTLVAAQNTGRKWIGFDIDEQAIRATSQRLREECGYKG